MNKRQGGFTLLEIILALAILGIGLGICLQIFSGGLKAVKKSEDYTNAVFLAKNKMEKWAAKAPLEESWESGVFEDGFSAFSWNVEVKPYQYSDGEVTANINADQNLTIKMMQILVRVSWEEGERRHHVELSTLRAYLEKEAAFL